MWTKSSENSPGRVERLDTSEEKYPPSRSFPPFFISSTLSPFWRSMNVQAEFSSTASPTSPAL